MLGFVVTAPLIDVASKLAAQTLPVGQVTAARFVVQGALMLPLAALGGHGLGLPLRLVGPVALRGLCLVVSTFAFVSAIDVMPLADALAIVFVMPFVLLILGRLVFGDAVGPRRIAACAVGFGGCLLVIQPSLAAFGFVALWPLATALSFAFYMLITRGLSPRMHPVPMQLHTSVLASAICLPVLWWAEGSGSPEFDAAWPQGWAWAWLLGVGAASAVSHMLMTVALRFAPSATLAPLNYLEIVTSVALGYLVFGDFPNALTWVGIGVIVASGLYVINRERLASAARGAEVPPPEAASHAAG
ncbi:DMT family transporter [Rubellimicrobium rubrum]|uniref:DMT family transporter n=2 Tax=Rubellimicrobium rubrum TaxID=2585369 RepID=A0A5C4N731_9RHOB|nr:DMT family transporter [Rubellimicrobium rubrum]